MNNNFIVVPSGAHVTIIDRVYVNTSVDVANSYMY